jgi:hypothetical protein
MSSSDEMPSSVGRCDIWFDGADGDRQAIRVDSRVTGGAYCGLMPVVVIPLFASLVDRIHIRAHSIDADDSPRSGHRFCRGEGPVNRCCRIGPNQATNVS